MDADGTGWTGAGGVDPGVYNAYKNAQDDIAKLFGFENWGMYLQGLEQEGADIMKRIA